MSLSGVRIRWVNPDPGPVVTFATVLAATTSSGIPWVVICTVEFPVDPDAPVPLSNELKPEYSRTRTSGKAAAPLKVTVTEFSPALILVE
jgi:hypothetical protein